MPTLDQSLMVTIICECNSTCTKSVQITQQEFTRYLSLQWFVIVDGCPKGPNPNDILIEKRSGYSLYEEG